MAGRGPRPKDPSRRARSDGAEWAAVKWVESAQPSLPEDIAWPPQTVAWWEMWRTSPLSAKFGSVDWAFLLDTAILHAKLWGDGDTSVLPELRLRVAKYGATPEDRARLRIQFADADAAEGRREPASDVAQLYANVTPLRAAT